MRFKTCIDDYNKGNVRWGVDAFVDSEGNEFVLTAQYGALEGLYWRITDKEANAIAAELGAK